MTDAVSKDSLRIPGHGLSPRKVFLREFRAAAKAGDAIAISGGAEARSARTWYHAGRALCGFVQKFSLPAPLITPLQGGGLGAEWHEWGLNIELRFRPHEDSASYRRVYALIEDAHGEIGSSYNYDNDFSKTRVALRELAARRGKAR